MPDVEVLTQLIGNVGFPIAVAGYCLYTLNKTLATVNASVNDNTRVISLLCEKMDATKNENEK